MESVQDVLGNSLLTLKNFVLDIYNRNVREGFEEFREKFEEYLSYNQLAVDEELLKAYEERVQRVNRKGIIRITNRTPITSNKRFQSIQELNNFITEELEEYDSIKSYHMNLIRLKDKNYMLIDRYLIQTAFEENDKGAIKMILGLIKFSYKAHRIVVGKKKAKGGPRFQFGGLVESVQIIYRMRRNTVVFDLDTLKAELDEELYLDAVVEVVGEDEIDQDPE